MDDEKHKAHLRRLDAIMDSIGSKFDILLGILSERFMVEDNLGEFENNSFKIPETGTPVVMTTTFDEESVFDGGREFKEDEQHLFDKIPQWSNFGKEELLKNYVEPMVTDDLETDEMDFNYIETEFAEGESEQEYQEKPPHPLHPKTFEPVKLEDLSPLFLDEVIKQEATNDQFIDISEDIIDFYGLLCPTPLIREKRLEKSLDTHDRIYYKYEDGSLVGAHKTNTSAPQVWYNTQQGVENLVTETGNGQWGSVLAFGSNLFGLHCEICQARASYDQKPYRRLMMQTWGAKVHHSPSGFTAAGQKILQMDSLSSGSLGITISEVVEVAAKNADTKYYLGSVLNHVLLHQAVTCEECIKQIEAIGETPDIIIGCTGGEPLQMSPHKGNFFEFDVNYEYHFHAHGGQQLPSNFTRGIVLDLFNCDFYDFGNPGRLKSFEELERVEIAIEKTKSVVKPWVERVTGFKGGTYFGRLMTHE